MIEGANFTGATAVAFDGVAAASFTVDSPTEITAIVPPSATLGTIGVTTPNGRGWSSDSFSPLPSIDSFAPNVGVAGTRVTITGANLLGATAVEFDGLPAASFSVTSPTVVTAIVPASAATGPLTIVTPGGSVSSSSPFLLRPVIVSLTPRGAVAGARFLIAGTNLGGAATVWLAGRELHFVRMSPSSLAAWVPKLARGGHVIVEAPTGRAVSPQRFQPEPSIASVEPHSVRRGARFAIAGANLAGTRSVVVGGRRARFRVVSPTLVLVTVPLLARDGQITVGRWGGALTTRIVVRAEPRR
jgi:hypothetical protein